MRHTSSSGFGSPVSAFLHVRRHRRNLHRLVNHPRSHLRQKSFWNRRQQKSHLRRTHLLIPMGQKSYGLLHQTNLLTDLPSNLKRIWLLSSGRESLHLNSCGMVQI
jgi:hypothetical protein